MHADGPAQEVVPVDEREHLLLVADADQLAARVLGAVPNGLARVGHHQRPRHARVQHPRDDVVPVRVKPRIGDVAMGIE